MLGRQQKQPPLQEVVSGVEAIYEEVEGVISVVSGYSGGDVENPSYEQVCDGRTGHAECADHL